MIFRLSLFVSAIALAGCASMQTQPPGKHLVYRDSEGKPIRQFDYPSDDICRKVQAVAGRQAQCTTESISATMQAQAVLRYVPPGIDVPSHYANMNRCAVDTRELGAGVQLVAPCSQK